MKVYENYIALYEALVIPLKKEHPDWIRTDGIKSRGNPESFGRFIHEGKKWQINADSHIVHLDKAYELAIAGEEYFENGNTGRKGRPCLNLVKPYNRKPKYMYIYLYDN